jgi:chromosome segregation ATPase
LGDTVAAADDLKTGLGRLKEENEEHVNKLSELEIEILELKENQELVEDQREKLLSRIKLMEEELLSATSAKQQVVDDAKAKEADHIALLDEIKKQHNEALEAISEERTNVVVALEALKGDLAASVAAHEQAKVDAQTALEEHTRKLEEAAQVLESQRTELSDEIKKITAELEVTICHHWRQKHSNMERFQNQEAHYNSKVDAVKQEHGQLLQDAFERAKVRFRM